MRSPAPCRACLSRRQFMATTGLAMTAGLVSERPVNRWTVKPDSRVSQEAAWLGRPGNPGSNSLPLIAFRIFPAHWLTDERFQSLLDLPSRQPGVVDELAFFTSATHAPLRMNEIERRAQRLAEILPRARARGFRAGINVLATIGHLEENLTNSLQVSWPQAMDPSGRVCRGSYCPAHPE